MKVLKQLREYLFKSKASRILVLLASLYIAAKMIFFPNHIDNHCIVLIGVLLFLQMLAESIDFYRDFYQE